MENNREITSYNEYLEKTGMAPVFLMSAEKIAEPVYDFALSAERNYEYDKNGNLREVKGNKGVDYSSLFEMEERADTLFNHPDNNRMMNHYDDVIAPQRYTSNIRNLAKENRMQAREARIQNRYSSSQIQTKPKEERIGYINKPVSLNKTSYLNFSNSLNNQNEIVMKPKKKEKNYEEIANVFYPDMPEVSQIKARAKKEMYEIEKERWTEHTKNFAGAGLEIGSSLIPAVKGVKIANTVAKAIAPKVGKKISQEIASGLVSGGLSGGVFGLGEGLLQDKNPIITALEGLAIGSATGAVSGLGIGKLENYLSGLTIKNTKSVDKMTNNERKEFYNMVKEFYRNYIQGLNIRKEGNILFTGKGLQEVLKWNPEQAKNFPALIDDFKKSKLVYTEDLKHTRKDSISHFEIYEGEKGFYIIAVDNDGKKRYYFTRSLESGEN